MVADAINSVGTSGTSGHKPGVFADLSAVTATTINQLRQAFQIQRMYERDARWHSLHRNCSFSFRCYFS